MKKAISILLSLVMVLSLMPITAYGAGSPPVIDTTTLKTTISSGNTTATIGDTVTISVKITSDAKILYAGIELRKPDGNDKTGVMQLNESTGKYEYKLTIESTTDSGLWKIYKIASTNLSGNRAEIVNSAISAESGSVNLSSANFTVTGTGGDTAGPVIDASSLTKSISDGKDVASVGDGVTLSLKVTDASGVASVKINYLAPDTTAAQYDFAYNSTTTKFEEIIVIEPDMASGDWRVVSIEATDIYNNKTTLINANTSSELISGYTADLSAGNFSVDGAVTDKIAPEPVSGTFAVSISSGKDKAEPGDTVTISVKVTDDSAIKTVAVTLQNPEGNLADLQNMTYNSVTDKYEAQIMIDENTAKGVWKISSMSLVDEKLNAILLHNSKVSTSTPSTDMSGCDFEVCEKQAPVHVHDYKVTATVQPSCTQPGTTTYTCDCGDSYTTQTADALGHVEVTDKAVAATFKAAGKTAGKHCDRCGAVLVAQKKIAKLGAPSISKLTAGKKQFKATWKSVKSIDGYQIQCSTSSKFKSGNKTVTVKGYKSASTTVKKLKAKKKYYVRIRAYKTINGKKQYSSWSKAKTVTTKK